MHMPHVAGPVRSHIRPLVLCAVVALAAAAVPGRATETFNLTLHSGWNLVSVPIVPTDNTIVGVFQGKNMGPVWCWDAATHLFNKADAIDPGKGYWVYAPASGRSDDPIVVPLTGELPAKANVALQAGWNLAGPLPT